MTDPKDMKESDGKFYNLLEPLTKWAIKNPYNGAISTVNEFINCIVRSCQLNDTPNLQKAYKQFESKLRNKAQDLGIDLQQCKKEVNSIATNHITLNQYKRF